MTKQDNDTDIFHKAASDPSCFRALVERFRGRVMSIAWRITGNAEDAHDVAQETFIKLHRSLNAIERDRSGASYLYRIATNTALDHVRKRRRTVDIDSPEAAEAGHNPGESSEQRMENRELHGIIVRLAEKLPRKQRQVFTLRDLEGFEMAEIADILGIANVTVRVHLARARLKLKRLLMKQYPDLVRSYREDMS